jgi:hypothetical protein
MVVRIAVAASASGDVPEWIAARTVQLTNVRPRIEHVDRNEIYDPQHAPKPRRIIDLRPPR